MLRALSAKGRGGEELIISGNCCSGGKSGNWFGFHIRRFKEFHSASVPRFVYSK